MDYQSKRPDPDELLRSLAGESEHRGHLKIFLGASAGVGKTYAMLGEAKQHLQRGRSVAIGVVETHGRTETETAMEGLPAIPMLQMEYRGAAFSEPDVDAIIHHRPDLVLMDELAHTNAPGSRHAKRWQDVEDLIHAGIDVFTAINVQHIESLNDVVEQVTGVRVQETVPDAFLEQADEIELIDIPPAELQQRLREGRVYVPDRIQHALEGFFQTKNLTALRELALRRTAETVDAEMQRLRAREGVQAIWATSERILVCIAPNRLAPRVVRAAARLAAASHAELIAVHVESDRQRSRGAEQHEASQDALRLAESLGMEVVSLQGHDIVAEIINLALRRNVRLIVVGKPLKPRWKELVFGSVVDELVRASGDIDIHVLTGEAEPARAPIVSSAFRPRFSISGMGIAIVALTVSGGLGFALFPYFGIANVAMLFQLVVVLLAMHLSRSETLVSSVFAVLILNFFFIEPRYTFSVSDARFALVFGVLIAVGLIVSTLTHRLTDQLHAASSRERRTTSLYSLSRQLAQGRGKREMAEAAVHEVRSVFEGDVAVFLNEHGKQILLVPSATQFEQANNEKAVAGWVVEHGIAAGRGTDTLPGSAALHLPLNGSSSTVGVLAFRSNASELDVQQRQLLETFANSLGLALERTILAKESNEARVQVESERIRNVLLSSISHDLRTPLTTITGAASSLAAGKGKVVELSETILTESIRLNRQIQNLLDMTRLQSGGVELDRSWHAPEDLMASALHIAQPSLGSRSVTISAEHGLPLLYVDGLLVEKALVNLIENAARHAGPDAAVTIAGQSDTTSVVLEVRDTGKGIDEELLDALFKPQFRTKSGGYGLGLAVVKAVCDLHGGEISATNDPAGGAIMRIRLPLPPNQPEVPTE